MICTRVGSNNWKAKQSIGTLLRFIFNNSDENSILPVLKHTTLNTLRMDHTTLNTLRMEAPEFRIFSSHVSFSEVFYKNPAKNQQRINRQIN